MDNMQRYELAKALPQKAYQDQKHLGMKKHYYFFNVYHPAIEPLFKRFRSSRGIDNRTPLSDTERTEFELSLLNGATLRELQAYCAPESEDTTNLDKEKTHCPPA